jgi:hypothetical protein
LNKELASYLLPEGILEYFDISNHKLTNDRIHFYLEEKNIPPVEYKMELVHSKGFSPEVTIEDFPLRGKPVSLHVKRRGWTVVNTRVIVKRDWDLIAKGTRITNEFATFLKGIT